MVLQYSLMDNCYHYDILVYDLLMLVGVYTSIALAEASTAAITSIVLENILNLDLIKDLDISLLHTGCWRLDLFYTLLLCC